MTKQEALEALAKINGRLYSERGYDEEPAHQDADEVLVEFLRSLGHVDVADAFEAIPKWYA